MSNVISLGLPRRQSFRDRLSAIVDTFAHHRRTTNDVYWLKENAELLNILEVTRPDMADDALAPYAAIYAGLGERLAFFPQYYRFLLALALDLEDLGLPGDEAERYCAQVMRAGLEKAELSDLQRAEAWRLLSRRLDVPRDASLEERLRLFAGRSSTFALPNKKAAYELTHIVFICRSTGAVIPNLTPPFWSAWNTRDCLRFWIRTLICCPKFASHCAMRRERRARSGKTGCIMAWAHFHCSPLIPRPLRTTITTTS